MLWYTAMHLNPTPPTLQILWNTFGIAVHHSSHVLTRKNWQISSFVFTRYVYLSLSPSMKLFLIPKPTNLKLFEYLTTITTSSLSLSLNILLCNLEPLTPPPFLLLYKPTPSSLLFYFGVGVYCNLSWNSQTPNPYSFFIFLVFRVFYGYS